MKQHESLERVKSGTILESIRCQVQTAGQLQVNFKDNSHFCKVRSRRFGTCDAKRVKLTNHFKEQRQRLSGRGYVRKRGGYSVETGRDYR